MIRSTPPGPTLPLDDVAATLKKTLPVPPPLLPERAGARRLYCPVDSSPSGFLSQLQHHAGPRIFLNSSLMIEVAYADPSDLGPPELRAQYLRLLDLPERKRFDRYVHDHHRLEFLTGRVMAKL